MAMEWLLLALRAASTSTATIFIPRPLDTTELSLKGTLSRIHPTTLRYIKAHISEY